MNVSPRPENLKTGTVLLLALLLVTPARAQSCVAPARPGGVCEIDLDIQLAVPDAFTLELQGTVLDWGQVADEDYDRGYRDYAGPLIRAWSNRPYVVRLETAPRFAYQGSAPDPDKSAYRVRWGTTPGIYPHELRPGGQTVMRGGPGPARGAPPDSERLHFRVEWNRAQDPPGHYQLSLRLTIATP